MGFRIIMRATLFCSVVVAFLFSASVGEDAPASSVVELTMDNFVEIVTDSKKHVLVYFHTPWCGDCKEFGPVYEKIAEHYKDDEAVVVAKLDAEAHAVFAKMYKVTSYPTLKVFPKKEKKGIEFTGDKTEMAVKEFVEKETY